MYKLIFITFVLTLLQAKEVEIYNEKTGESTYIDVASTRTYSNRTEIDTYDYDTNEYTTYSIPKEPAEQTPTTNKD